MVEEQSATLNLDNEIALPMGNSDHMSICKFAHSEVQRFKPLLEAIREVCTEALQRERKRSAERLQASQNSQQAIENDDIQSEQRTDAS